MGSQESFAKLRDHLQGVGYAGEALEYVMSKLRGIAALYVNKDAAAKVLTDAFALYVRRPFGDKQFHAFLHSIDPSFVGDDVLERELGILPNAVECLDDAERAEYFQEMAQLKEDVRSKSCKHHEVLGEKRHYDILMSAMYRKVPDGFPIPDEAMGKQKRVGSPMGGMPGYRRNMKRR